MDNYMAITCGKKNKPKKQTIKNMQTIKKLLLTLVALAALSAGAAAQTVTWNNETWADLTSTYMEHSFTVGDITLSHTGDDYQGFKRSESSGDPLYFYVSGSDLTFTSNGAPFTRIDMEMVNEYSTYNPAIQPLDGWTFDGQHAVWEGNAQSVTMTQCTTKVDQIVFTLSNPLMTLNASRDTATLLMPNADMTVSYELVRDIEVQTLFVGVPEEPVAVTKSGERFVFASGEAPQVALLDLLNQNAPIVDGATYSFEKQNPETGDFEASNVDLLADAQPGTWRIVVTATDDGHYTGTAKSQPFTVKAQPGLAWLRFNDQEQLEPMPAEGLSGYLGFTDNVMGSITFTANYDFNTATQYGNATLRFGSTDPSVVSFADPSNLQSASVNATGTCRIYMVFDGNDTYLRDSVSFPVTILAPATLTLQSNNSEWGSVELEGAGNGSSNGYTIKFSANGNTIVKENVTLPKTYQCEYGSPSEFDNIIRELYGWTGVHGNENAIPTVTGTDAITPGTALSGNHYPKFTINSAFQGTATVTIGYTNSSWESGNWPIEISFVPAMPAGVLATEQENVYSVLPGTTVTVNATAADGYHISGWSNAAEVNSLTAASQTLTVSDDLTLTATFAQNPLLTLASNNSEWGSLALGAGAPEETLLTTINSTEPNDSFKSGSRTFDNIATITFSGSVNNYNDLWGWNYGNADEVTLTVTAASEDYTITRVKFYNERLTVHSAFDEEAPFQATLQGGHAYVNGTDLDQFGVTKIEVYGYQGAAPDLPAGVLATEQENVYSVLPGTTVTVNATAADALHHVQGWQNEDQGALAEAAYSDYFVTTPQNLFPAKSTLTLQVTGDTTATAMFGINSYDLTATVAESDDVRGTVQIAYTDPQGNTQSTAAGQTASATAQGGSTSTLTATAETGYHFVEWQDNLNTQNNPSAQNPLTTTVAGDYTAVFDTNSYQITGSVAAASSEWGSVEGSGVYRHFTTATLTAMPIEHYHFEQWEDGNTQNPRVIDVTGEESHEATFAIDRFIVEWSSNDETMGHVVGPYDNHTTGNPIPRLQGSYGTQFNLTASPAEHHMLDHWSTGQTTNVITVTITEDAEIVANFKHVPYSVSVASENETMGTVDGSVASVEWQQSTEISATANYGYHFVQWNDGNTANPRTVTINEEHDYSFTALFAKNQYTVTVVTGDATRGSVSGTTTVDYLTDVEISATANEHYHFEQWEDGNMQNPRTVTVTANATYRAYFAPDKYTVTGLADQGQGSVTGSGSYAYLSNAMLTAEPACGYLFDHWSDESTESTITFQVTGEMSYTAFFRPAVVDTVTVEVHDTTVVTNTVTVHDTTYIDIHDSIDVTVHVHDTTIVEVPVYVHDTTTVTVTEYVHDTTTVTVTEYVHDTTVVNVPVHDTVYVSDGTIIYVHDTTTVEVPVNVYVHDTTTIEVQVPVYVHDTTTIEVQVPVYVYDTTTVYDTTVVEVPVHDTTTVTEYEYIHDTVEVTVIVHDTIFIHDTIFVGIEGVDALDAKIYGNNGQIVVEGADFNEVILFDVNGRILARRQDEGLPLRFDIPASGAYLVKIGNHAARRIVMIR